MDTGVAITTWAPVAMLVAARMAGVLLVAPVFGHAAFPVKLRLAMALVISLAVVARMARPFGVPTTGPAMILAAMGELAIGALIGYAARLLFVGIQIGAFHVAQQMGVALGEVYDPSDWTGGGGAVRGTFGMLAVVVFLLIGGHRTFLAAVLGTFDKLPVAGSLGALPITNMVVSLLAASFTLALNVAGPVLITMLSVTVALGLLQRLLPQCGLLSVQLPIRAVLSMLAMAGSIAILRPLLVEAVNLLAGRIEAIP